MNFEKQIETHFILLKIVEKKLNTINAPALKSEIVMANNEPKTNMILDLNDIEYVDSSGLSAILVANRLCKGFEKDLVLCHVQPSVMDLINISQLNNVLQIVPTLQEAKDLITLNELEKSLNESEN